MTDESQTRCPYPGMIDQSSRSIAHYPGFFILHLLFVWYQMTQNDVLRFAEVLYSRIISSIYLNWEQSFFYFIPRINHLGLNPVNITTRWSVHAGNRLRIG